MFDTKPYEDRLQTAVAHTEEELKKLRTGRAHPSMLDGVMVNAYGASMPLNQVGNVTVADSQMLQVTPFDPGTLQAIAAAIRDNQSLGLNPSDDGRIIRVPIPALTTERRQAMVKQLGEKVEECRIALRNVRHDALKAAKAAKDNKEITEDDYKRIEKGFDDTMNTVQSKLDGVAKAKEQEIMTV
ncbi:ribosome recycling factor [Candidatus Saccharibacteria bacterium]|nr:ribosome recycling factor [Candidatus Saccharibacteria bacterium]